MLVGVDVVDFPHGVGWAPWGRGRAGSAQRWGALDAMRAASEAQFRRTRANGSLPLGACKRHGQDGTCTYDVEAADPLEDDEVRLDMPEAILSGLTDKDFLLVRPEEDVCAVDLRRARCFPSGKATAGSPESLRTSRVPSSSACIFRASVLFSALSSR